MAIKLQDGGWFREFPLIGGLAGHALRNFTALVALLGGFLYALIALAYERFYRTLGIAPRTSVSHQGRLSLTQQSRLHCSLPWEPEPTSPSTLSCRSSFDGSRRA
jgi:hypothetical protein